MMRPNYSVSSSEGYKESGQKRYKIMEKCWQKHLKKEK